MDKKNFTPIESVEKKDEGLTYKYSYQNKPCFIYEVKTRSARKCADLSGIKKDLDIALHCLNATPLFIEQLQRAIDKNALKPVRFEESTDAHVLHSLYTTAIITYGKCFAKADARNGRIPEQKLLQKVGDELYALHREIINDRNTFVAHAGINPYEQSKTLMVLDPELEMMKFYFKTTHDAINKNIKRTLNFIHLIELVTELTIEQLKKDENDMHKNEIDKIPPEELFKHLSPSITIKH